MTPLSTISTIVPHDDDDLTNGLSVINVTTSPNFTLDFLTGFILCFFQFFMWDFIASLASDPLLYEIISSIGIKKHYISLSSGIIKLDDIIYLIGSIIIFHMLGVNQIKKLQHI